MCRPYNGLGLPFLNTRESTIVLTNTAILLVVCRAGLKALKPGKPSPESPSPAQPWVTALAGPRLGSRILQARAQPASPGFQRFFSA